MTEPLLRARNLRKAFGRTEALRGATIIVERGEVVAVTGPSGSGKSSLLLCLAGVLRPEAGEITYDGSRLDRLSESERTRLRRRDFGLALLVVTASLTVHAWESMHEHSRSLASLAALGASEDDLVRSQRWEAALAALPLAGAGVLVGGTTMGLLVHSPLVMPLVGLMLVLIAALLGAAIVAATSLTRPLVRRAAAPDNLRIP